MDNQAPQGRVRSTRPAFVYNRPHARQINSIDGFHMPAPKPAQPAPQPVHHAANPTHATHPAYAPKPVHVPRPTHPAAPVHTKTVASSRPQHAPAHPVLSHAAPKTHRPDLPKQTRSSVLHRQAVRAVSKPYKHKKYRRPLMPTLISAMAVVLFSFGAFAAIASIRTDKEVKAQVKGLASTKSEDDGITDGLPSEDDAPVDISGYSVAPDLPRFFDIEKLGVHARIRRLGVGSNNVLKAPANIFDVGWYDGSAKPGENGTVVIDGHVSGPSKRGVFYNIGTLKEGDKVTVERGDGKRINYTVTGTQVYDNDKVDMPKVMTTSVAGKPAMNFMTCTGRFNVRTNQYEQRVVVFTVQD